ncbi:MAG: TIGR01777 family oxidoreductase [Rikenellaceae bacterium]
MKIAISGSTGFIGSALVNYLESFGFEIVRLSRIDLEYMSDSKLKNKISGCYAVINLSGAPISKFWSKEYKYKLHRSRIETTYRLVSIINRSVIKPNVFISTSAIGIYNRQGRHDEESTSYDNTFLSRLCVDWEKEAQRLSQTTRLVILRLGIVLDNSGGYLKNIQRPSKFNISVNMGSKNKNICWISLFDLLRVYKFALFNHDIKGIVNACNEETIPQDYLVDYLHKKNKAKFRFRIPDYFIKLFAGDTSEIFVINQHAVPKKLIENKFIFKKHTLDNLF